MEQLYEQDLKINRKRLNELKAENKSEEICRMEDSYFKFILKERVLDGVGRELIRMYFGDDSVSGLSSGSEEIQVDKRQLNATPRQACVIRDDNTCATVYFQ